MSKLRIEGLSQLSRDKNVSTDKTAINSSKTYIERDG